MEKIKVEDLMKAKALLDQECFEYQAGGYGHKEKLNDVVSRMDTEGAVDYMEQLLQNWEKYCGTNGIDSDKYSVSMTFSIFYGVEFDELEANYEYIRENNIRPNIEDIVVVDSGVGSYYTSDGKLETEDPIKYADEESKSFVVSFSEFKKMLSERGFELEGVQSFENITDNLLEDRYVQPRARISHTYNKIDLSGLPADFNIKKDIKSFESDGENPMDSAKSLSVEETHSHGRSI